ncbi:MAG: hypothetical protein HQL36_02690, partial [Alphaproteobacteria bacterium]|nr:hypothetical protein [Alphaproteobacteria bacterium]
MTINSSGAGLARFEDPNDQALFDSFVAHQAAYRENPAAFIGGIAKHLKEAFAAPRDVETAYAVMASVLAGCDNALIHGGGSHTIGFIKTLDDETTSRIKGIIDLRPSMVRGLDAFPILTPEQAAAQGRDLIIVAHPARERDMVSALTDAGADPSRIVQIYSHPDTLERGRKKLDAIRDEVLAAPPRFVVVDTIGMSWKLVDDKALSTVFPANETLVLYLGRAEHHPPPGPFRLIDLSQSAALLADLLAALKPAAVYLRTTAQLDTESYAALIKEAAPGTPLIHELYDSAITFSDDYLQFGWGISPPAATQAKQAAAYSFNASDILIHKNGSALWDPFLEHAKGKTFKYYPQVSAGRALPDDAPTSTDGPLRIIYAGSIHSTSSFSAGSAFAWANVTPLFDRIVRDGNVEVTMYNSLHQGVGGDDKYADFLDRYGAGPIRYNRGVPLDALLEDCARHHYGWTAFYRPSGSELPLVDKVVLHNKFTSYLLAGIPVIVTDYFLHVAGLVREYNAGVVVASEEIET